MININQEKRKASTHSFADSIERLSRREARGGGHFILRSIRMLVSVFTGILQEATHR